MAIVVTAEVRQRARQVREKVAANKVGEALGVLLEMVKSDFSQFAQCLVLEKEARRLVEWFLTSVKGCLASMKDDVTVDTLQTVADVLAAFCSCANFANELNLRSQISLLYYKIAVCWAKLGDTERSVACGALALVASCEHDVSLWKFWIGQRLVLAKRDPSNKIVAKHVLQCAGKSPLCKWDQPCRILLLEMFWLSKLHCKYDALDNKYKENVLVEVLKSRTMPWERTDACIYLFRIAAGCGIRIEQHEPSAYLNEALRLLPECRGGPCGQLSYAAVLLCKFLNEWRSEKAARSPMPILSAVRTTRTNRKDLLSKYGTVESADQCKERMDVLDSCWLFCKQQLLANYHSFGDVDKERLLETVSEVASLCLLHGKTTEAVHLFVWLFFIKKSPLSLQHVVAALLLSDGPLYCGRFVEAFGHLVSAKTPIEQYGLYAVRLFASCRDQMEEDTEMSSLVNRDLDVCRSKAYQGLAEYLAVKFDADGEVESQETPLLIIRRCFGYMRAVVRHQLGEEDIKVTSGANRWLDIALFLWMIKENVRAYHQAGFLRECVAYGEEGLQLSLCLGCPIWVNAFLSVLIEFESKLYVQSSLDSFIKLAHGLYGFRPRPVATPVAFKAVRKLDFDSVVSSNEQPADNDGEPLLGADSYGEFYSFLKNRHSSDCQCWTCKNAQFRLDTAYMSSQLALLSTSHLKLRAIEGCFNSLKAIHQERMVEVNRILTELCPGDECWLPSSLTAECDLSAELLVNLLEVSSELESNEKTRKRLKENKALAGGRLATYYRLYFDLLEATSATGCDQDAEVTQSVRKKTDPKGAEKRRRQLTKKLLNELSVHGRRFYYPWYGRVHEWLALNAVNSDPWCAAFHFFEAVAVAARHLVLLERNLGSWIGDEEFPLTFKDVDDVKKSMEKLENSWTVVTLYLTSVEAGSELLIIRTSGRCKPLIVNLGSVLQKFDAIAMLDQLDKRNVASMQLKEKGRFWTARHLLDQKMQKFLDDLQQAWLAEMLPLLCHFNDAECREMAAKLAADLDVSDGQADALADAWRLLDSKQFALFAKRLLRPKIAQSVVKFFRNVNKPITDNPSNQAPMILILSKDISVLPVHAMAGLNWTPVTRFPCLHFVFHLTKRWTKQPAVAKGNAFYVLNPTRDLTRTQDHFERFFKSLDGWQGCVGRDPTAEEMKIALNKDLFIYCGHGSASRYCKMIESKEGSCRATVLLFGCSSGRMQPPGRFYEAVGSVNFYQMAQCPNVVALLWDVTDRDADRLLSALLNVWLQYCSVELQASHGAAEGHSGSIDLGNQSAHTSNLLLALNQARAYCKLKFLTGAAIMSYGLPVTASL